MSGYGVAESSVSGLYSVVVLVICVLCIVAEWRIFVKAGKPGWACLIPFYNAYVLFQIALGNGWLFLMMLIPLVNIYFGIKCLICLAHRFGKSTAFGIGLLLLSPVFFCILGFGDAKYNG